MKQIAIIYGILSLIFLGGFFLEIIPVAVNDMAGNTNGYYFTSMFNQLNVRNYVGTFAYLSLFILGVGSVKLLSNKT